MAEKTQIVITARDETRAAIASAQRGLESLKASGAGLANTFASIGVGGGLIGLIGGAGLAATVKTAIDSLDQLNEATERLGISAEDLSALDFAGKLNGVQFDELTTGLTRLSVKMQEAASGSKEAGAFFQALGIKVTDSSGRLKSADAVFAEVADAFAGMEDGAGKTALAVDAFGRSGAKLVPLLNQGADGLEKMRKEGEALGAVIDGKLANQAAEFKDNLDRLKTVSAAAGIAIANELLPSLNTLSQELLDGITAAGGFWAALNAGATLNPFRTTGENLASVRADLAKMEADVKEYGYLDEARFKRKQDQLKILEAQDARLKAKQANALGLGDIDALVPKAAAPRVASGDGAKAARGSGARSQADEAARLLQNLREQVALNEIDLQAVGKLAGAEKERAKTLLALDAGTLKATGSQREAIVAAYDALVVSEKLLADQEAYRKALEGAEQANVKNRQSMIEAIQEAEKAAELFGLNAAQISVVEQARLADAIAIARQNGASEDQIAVLEEELALRGQLSEALIKGETKRLGQKDAEDAIKTIDEMDQFAVQAARNMQTAFADFLFEPAKNGFEDLALSFSKTIQRMLADAVSAQILKALFGDLGKTGNLGGWIGAGLGELSKVFGFADGGIMTSAGPVPLRAYASGGIARSPQMAIFAEGDTPEAFVPVPSGKIPVELRGAAAPAAPQNIRIINAFDQSVIGDYLGSAAGERIIMNAVQRNAGAMRQALA